jgi:hypothetical protein
MLPVRDLRPGIYRESIAMDRYTIQLCTFAMLAVLVASPLAAAEQDVYTAATLRKGPAPRTQDAMPSIIRQKSCG